MILLVSNSANRLTPRAPSSAYPVGLDDMILPAARVGHLVPDNLHQYIGDFISPRGWGRVGKTPIWAADNDAFSGFDPDKFRRMLDRIALALEQNECTAPKFISMPDVVGNHARTLDRWHRWIHEFIDRGLPPAFVLQNGIDCHEPFSCLPPDVMKHAHAFFIGGDDPFKLGGWVREFVGMLGGGYWIHMGRVNGLRRLRYAVDIGCHSCDGSSMGRFAQDKLIPMAASLNQLTLFNAL